MAGRSVAAQLRRWLPLAILIGIAGGAWQVSQAADTDTVSVEPVAHEFDLATPILSARRIPETLQTPIADDAVQPDVEAFLSSLTAIQADLQTCLHVEVDGRVLADRGANLALIPASNQKIITTWAALEVFPDDTVFTTRALRTGGIVDGVLEGDLVLVGGGDPFLVTDEWRAQYVERDEEGNPIVGAGVRPWSRLEDLADRVAAAGITSISGAVVGDESLFDTERVGPWAERLVTQNQSGPLSALTVNEGFSAWGTESPAASLRTRSEDPARLAAATFADLLADRGITVGGVDVGIAPTEVAEVATLDSVPLDRIVTHVNSWSNNYGAEILVKHIGLAIEGQGSTVAGTRAIRSLLEQEMGLDLAGVEVDDGSGLAESNRVTCGLLAGLLADQGLDSTLGRSLSIGGERGSLEGRHVDTDADGLVFAKTGTLNPSTALSGFVRSADEPDVVVVFAYISNAELVDLEVKAEEEPFVEELVDYPEAPEIEVLDPLDPLPATVGG